MDGYNLPRISENGLASRCRQRDSLLGCGVMRTEQLAFLGEEDLPLLEVHTAAHRVSLFVFLRLFGQHSGKNAAVIAVVAPRFRVPTHRHVQPRVLFAASHGPVALRRRFARQHRVADAFLYIFLRILTTGGHLLWGYTLLYPDLEVVNWAYSIV